MKRRNRPTSSAALPTPGRDPEAADRLLKPTDWLFIAVLLAAVVVVYQPAWQGRLIWDDNKHVTRPDLRSWQGLGRIWFDLNATQQYYPLLHSAFWIEHRLWGDATLGYHLVNILLHATAAVLAALILRRLRIPGAYLAAAVFALHPVQVESVAWITEQKNTLSAVFYLAAMLTYLRFDQTRKMPLYFGALGLFVLGLLSKTVTATLPAALLVIFWWQRGRLSWRRDVLPLVPFFAIGAAAGALTAWVERKLIGAEGAAFDLTLVERCLMAGRAIWFYLGKLLWPSNLLFIYPRWQISQVIWWQYLFPLAALLLLIALWALRRRWRGPLAGLLYFVGTLFPVLGFFNVFPFIYSFVADHFQYLASLGVITLVSAGAALLLTRWRLWNRPAGYAICLVLLAILAGLTWRQSRMYADIETLYQTTIDRNPECWMARNNLGTILLERGQVDEAVALFRKALEIKPRYVDAYNNLGVAFVKQARFEEAVSEYRRALEIEPHDATAHVNLGIALYQQGRLPEAVAEYRTALQINPLSAEAHNNLGKALTAQEKIDEAMIECRKALSIRPDYADAHNNAGLILSYQGRESEAVAEYQAALGIAPEFPEAHNNLGNAWMAQARLDEAAAEYRKALAIKPDYAEARYNLGILLSRHGRVPEAIGEWRELVRLQPANISALSQLAWTLATSAEASVRDGAAAIPLALQAVKLTAGQQPAILDTLGAAQAEAGQFAEAIETAERARALASSQNNTTLAEGIRARIRLYEAGTPFREAQQLSPPPSSHP